MSYFSLAASSISCETRLAIKLPVSMQSFFSLSYSELRSICEQRQVCSPRHDKFQKRKPESKFIEKNRNGGNKLFQKYSYDYFVQVIVLLLYAMFDEFANRGFEHFGKNFDLLGSYCNTGDLTFITGITYQLGSVNISIISSLHHGVIKYFFRKIC